MTGAAAAGPHRRVAVLVSGGGSNLQALIDAAAQPSAPFRITQVISNRPGVKALDRAGAASIPAQVIDHTGYPDRPAFEADLTAALDAAAPDLIACAGFMRVLTEGFTSRWQGRLINIHPALLPSFKGLHTHRRALEAGVAVHGCTVHWVSAGVDEGAIIGQAVVPVLPGDTEAALAARVLDQEHRLYPACLAALCTNTPALPIALGWG
jgi:phosphoribosylglycinamide formyltransferase 1